MLESAHVRGELLSLIFRTYTWIVDLRVSDANDSVMYVVPNDSWLIQPQGEPLDGNIF
jgi:hypothetical protein